MQEELKLVEIAEKVGHIQNDVQNIKEGQTEMKMDIKEIKTTLGQINTTVAVHSTEYEGLKQKMCNHIRSRDIHQTNADIMLRVVVVGLPLAVAVAGIIIHFYG